MGLRWQSGICKYEKGLALSTVRGSWCVGAMEIVHRDYGPYWGATQQFVQPVFHSKARKHGSFYLESHRAKERTKICTLWNERRWWGWDSWSGLSGTCQSCMRWAIRNLVFYPILRWVQVRSNHFLHWSCYGCQFCLWCSRRFRSDKLQKKLLWLQKFMDRPSDKTFWGHSSLERTRKRNATHKWAWRHASSKKSSTNHVPPKTHTFEQHRVEFDVSRGIRLGTRKERRYDDFELGKQSSRGYTVLNRNRMRLSTRTHPCRKINHNFPSLYFA